MKQSSWLEVRQWLARHREWSVFLILCLEILVFYILLYPEQPGVRHTFFNLETFALIFRNSSVYGIAAIGAAMIITGGGIDVGAKAEIHQFIRGIAAEGRGVLMVSSELPELLVLCDRILVMREGSLTGELPGAGATEAAVMRLAVGAEVGH